MYGPAADRQYQAKSRLGAWNFNATPPTFSTAIQSVGGETISQTTYTPSLERAQDRNGRLCRMIKFAFVNEHGEVVATVHPSEDGAFTDGEQVGDDTVRSFDYAESDADVL